jgi:hypothetical protein
MHAFHKAVRDTRWHLGHWGYWSWGGSEEQVLSDLIADEIDYQIMGKVYSKISGPWIVRNTVRNQVLKALDIIVSAAVTPAWKAMSSTVEAIRPKVEPKIMELAMPLGEAKKKIIDQMSAAVIGIVNPQLEEHVCPHVHKIVEILTSPVREAYEESYRIFEEAISKYAQSADMKMHMNGFSDLNWTARSYWTMRPATSKLDIMYDPLWVLREIFSEISPWTLIWKGQDKITKKMDNAIYTFQTKLMTRLEQNPDSGKEIIEEVKNATLAEYKHDGEIHKTLFFSEIIKDIVMPPLNKILHPLVKVTLEPLDDLIPEPLKDFIDLIEMFNAFVEKTVDGIIEKLLDS